VQFESQVISSVSESFTSLFEIATLDVTAPVRRRNGRELLDVPPVARDPVKPRQKPRDCVRSGSGLVIRRRRHMRRERARHSRQQA
jgi:hypothetical protein